MLQDLNGQVAIVTGGSEGVGLATARLLASRGATVAICARRPAKLEEARKDLEQVGKVEAHQLDVADLAAYAALIEDVAARHGRLDMLVNNAMSVFFLPLEELTIENWRRDFAVNTEAVFISTQTAAKIMAKQEMNGRQRGSIVNISSTCGIRAPVRMSSYAASKAAMVHFTAAAAMDLAPHAIRVNCIVPGKVETTAGAAFAAGNSDLDRRIWDAIPMKRGGQPEELAEAIVFMLSEAASFITGTALPVDGGKAAQLYMPD